MYNRPSLSCYIHLFSGMKVNFPWHLLQFIWRTVGGYYGMRTAPGHAARQRCRLGRFQRY